MARKQLTLDEQIQKAQNDVWSLAELINREQLKNCDRIFESGLIFEETEFLKTYHESSDETKKDYLLLLNEMRKFYKKMCKQQQVEIA